MNAAAIAALLILTAVGVSAVVAVVAGVAVLMQPRRPDPGQHRTAGPLLDRTEPWA